MTVPDGTLEQPRVWQRVLPLGVMALLAVAALACASETPDVGGFTLGRAYRLTSGDQLRGDQMVVAEQITLEAGSVIDGNATLTGSDIIFDGDVNGDVVVVAEHLVIGPEAQVTGDMTFCAKDLEQDPAARIDGDLKEECANSGGVSASRLMESGWESWRASAFFRVGSGIIGSLLFGALAALGAVLFPRSLVRMSESVHTSPAAAGGVGCLTMLVAFGLTILYGMSLLLVLPVVLLPFVLIGWLIIGLLSLAGWMALAQPFGVLLFRLLRMDRQPRMIAAAMGGIALALMLRIMSVFWFTAWIGLVATAALGSVGLGAVILTRVGTRPYPRQKPDTFAARGAAD